MPCFGVHFIASFSVPFNMTIRVLISMLFIKMHFGVAFILNFSTFYLIVSVPSRVLISFFLS